MDVPLDVRKLRVLREVAQRGTLAAAAEGLHLTPSAVSQQLSALERHAGMPLVTRAGRGVALTPAAQLLVGHTERILAELEAASAGLRALAGEPAGEVHVASFASAICALLAPALPELRDRWPALELGIYEWDPERSLPALTAGKVDLALVYHYDLLAEPVPTGVRLLPVMDDPMLVAAPAGHYPAGPIEITALADARWMGASCDTSCHELLTRMCNQAGFAPDLWVLSDDFRVLVSLVAAAAGVCLVPALADVGTTPGVSLHPLSVPLHRRIAAAVRDGSQEHPALQAIVSAVAEQARR